MDKNAKREGLRVAGLYRWGCPCCTCNTRKGRRDTRRIATKAARRYLKAELKREAQS